jgi:hypothetical protein
MKIIQKEKVSFYLMERFFGDFNLLDLLIYKFSIVICSCYANEIWESFDISIHIGKHSLLISIS